MKKRVPRAKASVAARESVRRTAAALNHAYGRMRAQFGHQGWWPGDSPFEVCVGAILTQNTNWGNVERALARLKAARVLEPRRLYDVPQAELAQLIRPAGYFNIKARRLRAFLAVLNEQCNGALPLLFAGSTDEVRTRLLAIPGIGPETADSMLLYAGGHASFVVDAYTKRIFGRHRWCGAGATYEELQALCAHALRRPPEGDVLDFWQDYHAQLVHVGKEFCRARQSRCESCPLQSLLPPISGIETPAPDVITTAAKADP